MTTFLCIKLKYFPFKWIFFIQFAAAACLTFLPVFYQSLGLSPFWIGLICSLEPLFQFFGTPVWGGISDRWNIHKPVALFCLALSVIIYCAPYFVAKFYVPPESTNVCIVNNSTQSKLLQENENYIS